MNKVTLIDFFHCNNAINKYSNDKWAKVNKRALKLGYFIHPDALDKNCEDFINSKDININSTFYKTFNDVISKTRFELFIDQILHYITTYGTDFSAGNGYVPNDDEVDIQNMFSDYTVIMPCTTAELYNKCMDTVKSGIALKQSTMMPICDFIIENCSNFSNIDIDSIKNKEAQVYIASIIDVYPTDTFSLFRYIMYQTTGNSMIIKNPETYDKIKYSNTAFDFSRLTSEQRINLSTIFFRFKPLFLQFKSHYNNGYYINKIRKLANKYHVPFNNRGIHTLLSSNFTDYEIGKLISDISNFKIISLINYCNEIINKYNYIMYNIRNGKSWITEKHKVADEKYVIHVKKILLDELKKRLSDKVCYVKYNDNINFTAPTSEKNFIGNIPIGSSINLEKNTYIGIYWKEIWGTNDFDLSYINTLTNIRYGWDSHYYNSDNSVIYSGDMTNANPEAAEYFYFKNTNHNGIIYVNRFNGEENSKFKFIFGKDDKPINTKKCILDPSSVIVDADMVSTNKMQIIGCIFDKKFYFNDRTIGNKITSNMHSVNSTNQYEALCSKMSSMISIKEILDYCGFIDINTVQEIDDNINIIDLTNINKNTFIDLFTK